MLIVCHTWQLFAKWLNDVDSTPTQTFTMLEKKKGGAPYLSTLVVLWTVDQLFALAPVKARGQGITSEASGPVLNAVWTLLE